MFGSGVMVCLGSDGGNIVIGENVMVENVFGGYGMIVIGVGVCVGLGGFFGGMVFGVVVVLNCVNIVIGNNVNVVGVMGGINGLFVLGNNVSVMVNFSIVFGNVFVVD